MVRQPLRRRPSSSLNARTADVSRLLRFCSAEKIPVTARGAGLRLRRRAACRCAAGVALSLARMNRILELNDRDFVAVVNRGSSRATSRRRRAARGVVLSARSGQPQAMHLGGNIATNAGGPRCLKYGVTRHYVLGLEVVLADGDSGALRRPDAQEQDGFRPASGCSSASEGMLGVVTEARCACCRCRRRARRSRAAFATCRAAAGAVQAVFARGLAAGGAGNRGPLHARGRARIRRRGPRAGGRRAPAGGTRRARDVAARRDRGAARAAARGAGALAPQTAHRTTSCERLWELRRKFSESLKATGLTKLNEDVVVPRGRLVDLIDFAAGLQTTARHPGGVFRPRGRRQHPRQPDGGRLRRAGRARRAERALDELFAQVIAWGGAITGEHGIGLAKRRWWPLALSAENQALHKTLKCALDPAGILNRGKFVGGSANGTGQL